MRLRPKSALAVTVTCPRTPSGRVNPCGYLAEITQILITAKLRHKIKTKPALQYILSGSYAYQKSIACGDAFLCASGGTRTRTNISAQGIFLPLWLSPPFVCGLDYSFTFEIFLFRCVVSSLCTFLLLEAWLKITIGIIR